MNSILLSMSRSLSWHKDMIFKQTISIVKHVTYYLYTDYDNNFIWCKQILGFIKEVKTHSRVIPDFIRVLLPIFKSGFYRDYNSAGELKKKGMRHSKPRNNKLIFLAAIKLLRELPDTAEDIKQILESYKSKVAHAT